MYQLYYAPGACSMVAHCVLEYLGCTYQLQRIQLDKLEQRSNDYKRLNPMAKVPTLQTTEGPLTELAAILIFLAERHPTPALLPETSSFEKAKCLQWVNFFASEMQPTFSRFYRPERFSTDTNHAVGIKQVAQHRLLKMFTLVEHALQDAHFLVQNQLTIADFYLYAMLRWAEWMHLPLENNVVLQQHRTTMEQLNAVQRVLQQEFASS